MNNLWDCGYTLKNEFLYATLYIYTYNTWISMAVIGASIICVWLYLTNDTQFGLSKRYMYILHILSGLSMNTE